MPRHPEVAPDPPESRFGLSRRSLLIEAGSTLPLLDSYKYRHESELLASLPGGGERWWRDPQHRYRSGFDPDRAAIQLADALSHHRQLPEDRRVLLAGLDRQLMARTCLRLGAWELLRGLLGAQLRECRSLCPTPYRLGRATGLAAEWALAAGLPEPAFAYIDESLAWGTEPHRAKSYFAYAHALQGGDANSPLGDLPWLMSFEATRCQPALSERHGFSILHALRHRCLRLLGDGRRDDGTAFATLDEGFSALRSIARVGSPQRHLAILAVAVVPGAQALLSSDDRLADAIAFLKEGGRWRDLSLLKQADCCRADEAGSHDFTLSTRLNSLVPELALEPPGPVDRDLLDMLPSSLTAATPDEARRRFLCCI